MILSDFYKSVVTKSMVSWKVSTLLLILGHLYSQWSTPSKLIKLNLSDLKLVIGFMNTHISFSLHLTFLVHILLSCFNSSTILFCFYSLFHVSTVFLHHFTSLCARIRFNPISLKIGIHFFLFLASYKPEMN